MFLLVINPEVEWLWMEELLLHQQLMQEQPMLAAGMVPEVKLHKEVVDST